jgi:Predicted AAA-ATPase/PD-(D/E)XK nuclease superfamily
LPQNQNSMIRLPYGESDFKKLREEGYFYQDRSLFIEKLEKWNANYPVFLRPRRFGKSLFVSMLQYYYGLEYKADFPTLFGDLYIGKKPTAAANKYLVLRFEFSRINTATHESTYAGFLNNVRLGATDFLSRYAQFFTKAQKKQILLAKTPEGVINSIFSEKKEIPHKIYVIIDEYDQFANELLSFDMTRFKSDVSRNGFVRKFYESLKTATGEGIVDKIFITGVSPVTLDSLTSGFNITSNITLNPIFNEMMGFIEGEVENLLHLSNIAEEKIPTITKDLKEWYDGYRFSYVAENHLYNPDMVLYFLLEYGIQGQYPKKMLDTNIISDYRKISNIFKIGGEEIGKFEILEDVVKIGYIDFELTEIFNLEAPFTESNFLSLLYYMGLLTCREPLTIGWRFEVPNYVIKKLYFEYFASIYLEKTRFSRVQRPIAAAITAMLDEANPDDFFKIIETILQENHANRDELVYGEKHLQTLMIGLLCPYESYTVHSEYESRRGFPDIFIERMPDKHIKYEVVLELKYVKKKDIDTLSTVIENAEKQLDEYMTSERFQRPNVRGFYVVFLGGKVNVWKQWV